MDDESLPPRSGSDAVDATLGMPCILADLADGRLNDDEASAVADWLAATAEEPSHWVVNRAVRIAGQAVGTDTPRPSMWRRLTAALVFDSQLQPRIADARSVGLDHRRLLYQAGGVEIDLEISPSATAGRLRIHGHLTANEADLTGAWVIVEGPSRRVEGEVDQLGQFTLDGLVSGVHRMEIGLAYALIEIPSLQC